jgi:hypothetical protein
VSTDVFCHRCGHRNPSTARFCSSCGAELDVTLVHTAGAVTDDTEHHENLVSEVLGVPCLAVESGHRAGAVYALDKPTILIGRHPESDVFLDDITVSRRHAEVHQIGDVFEVHTPGGGGYGTPSDDASREDDDG